MKKYFTVKKINNFSFCLVNHFHFNFLLVKFLIFFLVFKICIFPTHGQIAKKDATKTAIILAHPTIRNVQTLLFLINNSIFPAPKNTFIYGVYHEKAEYKYQLTEAFIAENQINNIQLIGFKCLLHPENIYEVNDCTVDFYRLFDQTTGIIFFGGPDIPPICYGQETNLLTSITDPYRHYLELSMAFHLLGGYQNESFVPYLALNQHYAILGICLGMQTINVATGGTLYQDIPTQIYNLNTAESILRQNPEQIHRNYHHHITLDSDMILGSFHSLKYPKSELFDSLNGFSNQSPFVWSSHHQCIQKIGKGLRAIAFSQDEKIIEAIKHEQFLNVLGVQFHPEIISIFNDTVQIKTVPTQTELKPFSTMFPEYQGMIFHMNLWKYVALIFFWQKSEIVTQ